MFNLEKLKDNNAIFWIFRFDDIRKVAAECGWAIAVHGSVVHDLDLMAMPWVEEHTTADELAERLSRIVVSEEYYREPVKSKPGDKPNGRIVYTIFAGQTYIDMNVIETPGKNAIMESVIDWLHLHTAMSEYEYELMRKDLEG